MFSIRLLKVEWRVRFLAPSFDLLGLFRLFADLCVFQITFAVLGAISFFLILFCSPENLDHFVAGCKTKYLFIVLSDCLQSTSGEEKMKVFELKHKLKLIKCHEQTFEWGKGTWF